MLEPMHPLVDFLNHGLLPFTGRGAEAGRIIRFWRGSGEAHGLQAMLLVGEAGMGKSRMVEEIASEIKRANGAVVHTKLYPESATSIAPLVARAIWRYSSANHLLKIEPEETIASAVGALRRLVRLRQTLLIFEDVHLLNGEGLADFATLLDALADEHVAVLCLARPAELAVRPLLERHLVDEVELAGLGAAGIEELWSALFADRPDQALTELLLDATTGNPLALRSALRGALKSGAIARAPSGSWRITLSPAAFEEALARSVRLLSEGMAAHLTDNERWAAEQIACLGEVVSREAASAMIGGEHLLDLLAFKGIVVETGTSMPPLAGNGSTHALLAFTHTLLHRRLAENATVDAARITHIIVDDLPLYSTVPFGLIGEHVATIDPSGEVLARLIDRALSAAGRLESGPDWRLALDVWQVAEGLFELYGSKLGEDDRFIIQARLHELRIQLLRGQDAGEEYGRIASLFMELTERALPDHLIEYRLQALRSMYWHLSRRDYAATAPIRAQVDALIEAHPWLRLTRSYVVYLSRVAHAVTGVLDMAALRVVEGEMNAICDHPEATDETRRYVRRRVGPHLLTLYDGIEELEGRLRLLAELEADQEGADGGLKLTRLALYINISYLHEARAAADEATTWYRVRGQIRSAHYCQLMRLYCVSALDDDYASVEAEAEEICLAAEPIAPRIRQHASTYFAFTGLLRGDAAWARRVTLTMLKGMEIDPTFDLALSVGHGDGAAIERACRREEAPFPQLRSYVIGEGELDATIEQTRLALNETLVRAADLLGNRIVFDIIDHLANAGRKELEAALKNDLRKALLRSLDWLDALRLLPFMTALLEKYGRHLDKSERTRWRARIAELTQSKSEEVRSDESTISLSMLGSIEAVRPGEEPLRPRGVRLRTLLGLMVADRMLETPLSQREFSRLAASDAAEIEDARKTVNLAVHRLREMLGHEAILTDGETPRLNLDIVRVDLLEAHRLLSETAQHVRDGFLPRAFAPLLEALEITGGEVPFPTLYDDFFEAAREDFENRLRLAVMRVARGLLHDGDAAGAEQLLRRAFTAMPEDEELAALLAEALIHLGKRTEARRIKLQADGVEAGQFQIFDSKI
jgi:hypothetical protein